MESAMLQNVPGLKFSFTLKFHTIIEIFSQLFKFGNEQK